MAFLFKNPTTANSTNDPNIIAMENNIQTSIALTSDVLGNPLTTDPN